MRIRAECIPCLLRVRMNEILESNLPEEEKLKAELELLNFFSKNVSPQSSTIELASKCFSLVKKLLKNPDPYKEYKIRSNYIANSLIPTVLSQIKETSGYKRLRSLLIVSINANILDPGAPPFTRNLNELKSKLLNYELTLDDTQRILDVVRRSRRIVYLLDNAGEAVFDKLVVEELAKAGKEIIVVAKGGAYQNDITYEEVIEMGFNEVARVLSTKSDYAAVLLGRVSDEVSRMIVSADLIIAKGMANYEAFLYTPPPPPVAHLFIAKCRPVADTLGISVGSKVALLRY